MTAIDAAALEQRVRFLRDRDLAHRMDAPVHDVAEWDASRARVWVRGSEWGVVARAVDGHEVEVPAEWVTDHARQLSALEPPRCTHARCDNYAPDWDECGDHTGRSS